MGRRKAIETPEELEILFERYRKWCKDNPIKKIDFKGKDVETVYYEYEQPLSWRGFDAWLWDNKIIMDLEDYRINTDGRYDDFKGVISGIRKIIESYQVSGAMVGTLKENLVSRLNGLAEKKEVKSNVTIEETKIGFE